MFTRYATACTILIGLAAVSSCRGADDRDTTAAVAASPAARSAAPSPASAPPPRAAKARVVLLGDSLTAGLGLPETQAYPALLQQKIEAAGYPFEVVNAGVSGDTTAGGLRRLDWSLDGDVRVLVLALGANDGLRGLPVSQMEANLERVITAARARGIIVVLAGMEAPPNYGAEYTSGFRSVYTRLAGKHELVLIPFLLDRVAGISSLNQGDGIHPNAEGASIIADTVWSALRPVLEKVSTSS